jgi:hypothetical protein
MVAGVAGLIRSLDPNMAYQDVTRFIDYTADDRGAAGFDTVYGFGRLNAYRAVLAASTGELNLNAASPGETYPSPNPFDPSRGQTVSISVPASLGTNDLKIQIFLPTGERVRELDNSLAWDGKNDDGNTVASGLYIYRVKTSNGDATGKVTVLKR